MSKSSALDPSAAEQDYESKNWNQYFHIQIYGPYLRNSIYTYYNDDPCSGTKLHSFPSLPCDIYLFYHVSRIVPHFQR